MTTTLQPPLLRVKGVSHGFKLSEGQHLNVLDQVSFDVHAGEFIAILGKSGAGKSTLVRIMTGLLSPSKGEVLYQGDTVYEPLEKAAMVFQNFALLPWLSVLQNVELGLEAKGLPANVRRKRAIDAIDAIGLDGFESAYPKELSGGMRQRVGLARALVTDPELLVMDEPFSALDVLTAENLRGDLIQLWRQKNTQIKSIICVTHNIEEAVLMADRILIFNSDPGRIRADLPVTLPADRDPTDPKFRQLVDEIYTLMTTPEQTQRLPMQESIDTLAYRLPEAEVSELVGLVDAIWQAESETNHAVDLPYIADSLHMDANRLLPLTEALSVLALARVSRGDILLTPVGEAFAKADILKRKDIFAHQLKQHIPLAAYIRQTLDKAADHRVNENTFLDTLEKSFSEDEADRVLKVIIDWGRYAEIFAYDYDSGDLSLENPSSDDLEDNSDEHPV